MITKIKLIILIIQSILKRTPFHLSKHDEKSASQTKKLLMKSPPFERQKTSQIHPQILIVISTRGEIKWLENVDKTLHTSIKITDLQKKKKKNEDGGQAENINIRRYPRRTRKFKNHAIL